MAEFSNMINMRHPAIDGAFGFMDGLRLLAQTISDPQLEEVTYNGRLHLHCIGNIFVFAPNGEQSVSKNANELTMKFL